MTNKNNKTSPFARWHNDFLIKRLGAYVAHDTIARDLIAAYPGDFAPDDLERIVKRCDNLLNTKRKDPNTGELAPTSYRVRIDELRAEFDRQQNEKLAAQPIMRSPDRAGMIQQMHDEARELKAEAREIMNQANTLNAKGLKKLDRKDTREAGLNFIESASGMMDRADRLLKRAADMEVNIVKLAQDETSPRRTGIGVSWRQKSAKANTPDATTDPNAIPEKDDVVNNELNIFFGEEKTP